MRTSILIIVVLASSVFALLHFYPDRHLRGVAERGGRAVSAGLSETPNQSGIPDLIPHLERYDDADYGFSVAIPSGWTRIVAAETEQVDDGDTLASLEPGYAVGFESPRSDPEDRFADYILIEVLPGQDSGLFDAAGEQQGVIYSGTKKLVYDRLEVNGDTDAASEVDLVIFQHGVQALGYTIGFYAIGEPTNEQVLFNAFQIMLRTFTQTSDPYVII